MGKRAEQRWRWWRRMSKSSQWQETGNIKMHLLHMLKDVALHFLLSWDNAECADEFLLSVNPPVSNNQNLIQTVTACFSWWCYPLTELVSSTSDFINVLAAPCLSGVYPHSISETRDKYQHLPFICQGLWLDRESSYWMSPSPIGNGPRSHMRYVTRVTEVTMFPVCAGA